MDILIETCLNDLYILLFNNYQVSDRILIKNLREKSDHLPIKFEELLSKNKLKINQINRFFVTNGPGSFMGIRAGLLFSQTLAGVFGKKIFTCSTLHFLQSIQIKPVFIDARGDFFYTLINNKISLQQGNFKPTIVNYDLVEKNLSKILKNFQEVNAFDDNTLYVKKPRIG